MRQLIVSVRLLGAMLVVGWLAPGAAAQSIFDNAKQPVSVSQSPPKGDGPVSVSLQVSQAQAAPGSDLVLAVVLEHEEHYHTNLNKPIVPKAMGDFYPVATTLSLPQIQGLGWGAIQYPDPVTVDVDFSLTGNPIQYQVYSGTAVFYVPVHIDESAALGERTIEIRVNYQACNETACLPPTSMTPSLSLEIVGSVPTGGERSAIFDGFDPARAGEADGSESRTSGSDEPVEIERRFLGLFVIPPVDSAAGVVVLALAAAVGGLILNLTPCVLPVIPIKVMTISQHAGESRPRAFMLSLWMALGVIAFWVGIGIPVAFVADFVDPSIIFGLWWLTALIGVVILLMGIGIMGLFQITLPQKIYMINPKADSYLGSFVFGVMTAVLGLPCFGFVAGALLAGAATMPPVLVLTIFACMGIGMALPYIVLAMFPGLIEKLPRTGPASELVKQVMGLLMLAAGAYFLGTSVISYGSGHAWVLPWWAKAAHWWLIGLLGVAAGGWLTVQTIRISKRWGPRVSFAVLGLLLAISGAGIAYNQTTHLLHNFWEPYSPALLEQSLGRGQIVVLDFTAEWCLNCKTLEATVLSRNPVKSELLSADVVPMSADLTSMNAPGWERLRDLGQTGIPLLVVYAPGKDEPIWLSNAYGSAQVVDAIEQARGRITRNTPTE